MDLAVAEARRRVKSGGWLMALTADEQLDGENIRLPGGGVGWVNLHQVE
jgi:hypothetical protein